jgi:hypothetical protein
MLELWFREHLENQAITDVAKLLPKLEYNRRVSITYYIFCLITAILAFCLLFLAHVMAARNADKERFIVMVGILCSGLLVLVSQYLKRNATFLDALLRGQIRTSNYLRTRTFFDPLYYQFYVILVVLCLLLVLSLMTGLSWKGTPEIWVSAGSEEHENNIEAIKQFMSFSLTILGAQLALFTFVFSYLLGRYSSQIVKSLIIHRAVLFAWASSIGALTLQWVYFSYGYPRAIDHLITPIFVIVTISCLIITIWVCVSGIDPERAVLYAGARFAQTVRRRIKRSILVLEGKPSRFWTTFRWLGLDWRDPERMRLYEPPRNGPPVVSRYLASLFNAANKAIEENQQELLSHSLMAILSVLQGYIERRKTYYGSRDSVLNEANNQMAALLKAACNSLNEHMATLVVRCIGRIAALSLQIEEQPPMKESVSPFGPVAKRHALSLLWAGLLEESFELTHPLLRTTAPYEAIEQLTVMGALCHEKEYFDTMATTFFSNIQKIHAIAVKHADAYHRELGRKCIEGAMSILALASRDIRKYRGSTYRPFDQCLTALAAMARGQFVMDALPDFNLNGCGSILTSKSSDAHIILQDIFYSTLSRPLSRDYQPRTTINDLRKVIRLVADLAQVAAMERTADNGIFITAFYEISYLVLRGLPKSLENPEDSVRSDTPLFREYMSSQDELDTEALKVWRDLFSVFFDNRIIGWDWESYMCAVLGIGFANIEGRKSDVLRNQLLESVQHLRQRVVKTQSDQSRNIDHWWPYLQLLGAWISGFSVKDAALSGEIAAEVGRLKPFHSFLHGYSGHSQFEPYGYPASHWGDFCLPKPHNLLPQGYMTRDDIQQFLKWQASLMSSDLLLAYHKEVEKTRSPLREEFYKRLRESRAKCENREQTEEDGHSE